MGLATLEENRKKINWVSIDRETGKFIHDGKAFEIAEGQLIGFNTHEFEFKNRMQKKFDLFIRDNGAIYQLQFGRHTWTCWRLLNQLMSAYDNLEQGKPIQIVAYKDDNDNQTLFVRYNHQQLKWKVKFAEAFKSKNSNLEELRNKQIDKWIDMLLEKMTYNPFEENIDNEVPQDDEDLPF